MRGEFIDVGGARLYYYAAGTRGAGEPVVLIHGFPTSSHLWAGVVPLVPAGHRVIVPDLMGFGRSDPPPLATGPAGDLSIHGHADRILALLDELRVERACLVGHGIGAAIALSVADRHPERVTRLCLVNAVTAASWPSRQAQLARAVAAVSPLLPSWSLLSLVRRILARGLPASIHVAHVPDQYLRPFSAAGGSAILVRHLRALSARPAPPPPSQRFAGPTAIVWGAQDGVLPIADARLLHTAIPQATLDVISGGHVAPIESPEQVAAVLTKLLAVSY
jgi:pimeloyl-ACP methyl ester carboxylesterase